MTFVMTEKKMLSNDELTIFELFKLIFRYKFFVFFFTTFIVVVVFFVTLYLPKTYKVDASFFVNQSKQSPAGSLGMYSSLLGGGDTDVENRIQEVIKSRSMEKNLIRQARPFFPETYSERRIQKELNMKKNFQLTKTAQSLYRLEFESHNQDLSLFVVDEVLKQIFLFNEKLALSEKSEVIIVLDAPVYPELPSGPRRLLNMAVGCVLGFVFSVFCVVLYSMYRDSQGTLNSAEV